ncbi:MAG: TIGR00725 family protein [Planctomycetota bacterium]
MKTIVSVIGGGSCSHEDCTVARELGRLLAERGWILVTGGLGGVMEAASRGAHEAGGTVIGVLPGVVREEANPYVDIALTTGVREARNVCVATSGHAVVAVGGGFGTLSEIAFALKHGRPVFGLGTWTLPEHRVPREGVQVVDSPAEAVERIGEILS